MTFIPSVQSNIDSNNSTTNNTGTTYTGSSSRTTGYNQISISITSTLNSSAGGLEIQFSSDNSNWTTYFKDTYFTNTSFVKTYNILNTYYRIKYATDSSTFTITTRLSTDVSPEQSNVNSIYSLPQDGIYDAFGKLRVSEPYTLLDIKFPSASTGTHEYLSNSMLMCNDFSGSGTGTYELSKCTMSANGATGNFISQSRKYCIYQPGKSLLILNSGIIGSTGITSTNYSNRIGYFDDENGLFFENSSTSGVAGTMNVVLRNKSPSGVTGTYYPQTNWNIDKLDGSGNSGINLDFTKSQLFAIDFEWLSVGRIRFGFYIYGKLFYCHQITNVNTLENPYMLTPNLPIRYEVSNNQSSGKVYLTQICSCVITEGGYNPIGRPFSANNGVTGKSISTDDEYPLLAIRGSTGSNTYKHQNVVPTNLNILDNNKDNLLYNVRLYLAPNTPSDITGSWVSVNNNSLIDYNVYSVGGTLTNPDASINISSGYIAGNSNLAFGSLNDIFTNLTQITSSINNESDILLITGKRIDSAKTLKILCSLDWTESD